MQNHGFVLTAKIRFMRFFHVYHGQRKVNNSREVFTLCSAKNRFMNESIFGNKAYKNEINIFGMFSTSHRKWHLKRS